MGEEAQGLSEFNMAVAYMNRLHFLLVKCDETSTTLDVYGWYHCLAAIFRELSPEIRDPKIKEAYIKTLVDLNTQVNGQIQNKRFSGINDKLYFALQSLEIELRGLMKERGLYNKETKDASSAIYR